MRRDDEYPETPRRVGVIEDPDESGQSIIGPDPRHPRNADGNPGYTEGEALSGVWVSPRPLRGGPVGRRRLNS